MRWAILVVAFTLGGPELGRAQDSPPNAHVVLISIEGFAAARLEDEGLELPNLRALIRSGTWAASSETVLPAIDHPAHTSILTGVPPAVHGVIGNRLLNRKTGEYFHVTNKPRAESIKVATLFDAAKRQGLSTASFFWPETRDDPSIDVQIPLVLAGDGKASMTGADQAFLQELRDNDIPIDLFFEWYYDLALQMSADRILSRAAAHVIETRRPNFVAIRLPGTDRYQHQYGPDHYLSKAAFTAADANVGIVRRAVERAGIADETTILVVSDHGFHAVPFSVNIYPLFEEVGLLDVVTLHTGFWSVVVELTERFEPDKHQRALDQVFERALRIEGVTRVILSDELEAMGLPRYEDDPHMLGHHLVLGDIDTRVIVDRQNDSTKRTRLETPYYGHGYLPSHELMYPILLVAGRRIKENERIGHVHNYDIAPTICELLGLEMPGLVGRVLEEMFEK